MTDETIRMARIMEPTSYAPDGSTGMRMVAERHARALYDAGYRLRHEHESRIGMEGADE